MSFKRHLYKRKGFYYWLSFKVFGTLGSGEKEVGWCSGVVRNFVMPG